MMAFIRPLILAVGILAFLGSSTQMLAQVPSHRTCGTTLADSVRRANNPQLGSQEAFEAWLQRAMTTTDFLGRAVTTIPVIVHVVHDGEPAGIGNNISIEQIRSQIDVLNEDFRRKAGTPGGNSHPDGADTEIEFCLATIDTAGQPLVVPGVHRIDRNTMGWNPPPYSMSYADQVIKPQSIWEPHDYLNIWVMPLSSGLLGFAQTPDASTLADIPNIGGGAGADGVVIRPTSFGRVGNVNAPYNQGRTTTHELGHWLGLIHVSGDGNCSFDDGCDDTPVTGGQNYGCPAGAISCGQPSMIENYMEYTDDACMNVFTQCQKVRMLTVLANSPRRKSLATSNACSQEVPPAAWFSASSKMLCAGQSIQLFDQSSNTPTGWTWTFPGGNPASSNVQNPVVQYSQPGVYEVSLSVVNSYGSTTLSRQGYVTVNASGPSGLFFEDFEGGIPSTWEIVNPDQGITWNTREVEGHPGGDLAAFVNCYLYASLDERDALISPSIDLSVYSGVFLSFDHAYRRYADGSSTPSDDSLLVYASTDGGQTFPFLLAALGENGGFEFATNTDTIGLFVPQREEDWCFAGPQTNCQTIDLSAFDGESDLRIKFEVVNDYGNAIYLDNVLLAGICSVTPVDRPLSAVGLTLFPNPARDQLTVEVSSRKSGGGSLSLQNALGQVMMSRKVRMTPGKQSWNLDVRSLPAGIYVLAWEAGGERLFRQVLLE